MTGSSVKVRDPRVDHLYFRLKGTVDSGKRLVTGVTVA